MTVADLKNGLPATRVLLPGSISTATVPEAALPHAAAHAIADETIPLLDELTGLLGDILDALSPEELGGLPESVWALLYFIAAPMTPPPRREHRERETSVLRATYQQPDGGARRTRLECLSV